MGGLLVFVPKEQHDKRVSQTPSTIKTLLSQGAKIQVERSAGEHAGFSNKEYEDAGASLFSHDQGIANADVICAVNAPSVHELGLLKRGAVWVSHFMLHEKDLLKKAAQQGITLFSMNLVPRISRAQKMDALSSQSALAGYKAVIMAAHELGKAFPLQMTAAGTLQPAKVVVIGAGVAGLAAIATAKRLGALVEASDVRPAAKEQVESLGAKFIEVPFDKDAEDKGGYAKGASPEFLKRQAEEVDKRLRTADIVITTALVPGKKAPILITEEQVRNMKPASVIVDMAAIQGGNCALTEPGKITKRFDVTIIAETNIPSTIAISSTELYAKNITNFLCGIIKNGSLSIDKNDQVYSESLVVENGIIVNQIAKKIVEEPEQ